MSFRDQTFNQIFFDEFFKVFFGSSLTFLFLGITGRSNNLVELVLYFSLLTSIETLVLGCLRFFLFHFSHTLLFGLLGVSFGVGFLAFVLCNVLNVVLKIVNTLRSKSSS